MDLAKVKANETRTLFCEEWECVVTVVSGGMVWMKPIDDDAPFKIVGVTNEQVKIIDRDGAYWSGYRAAYQGFFDTECPYHDWIQQEEWQKGYAAYHDKQSVNVHPVRD